MALRGPAVRVRLAPFGKYDVGNQGLLLEEEIGHNGQLYLPSLRWPTLPSKFLIFVPYSDQG